MHGCGITKGTVIWGFPMNLRNIFIYLESGDSAQYKFQLSALLDHISLKYTGPLLPTTHNYQHFATAYLLFQCRGAGIPLIPMRYVFLRPRDTPQPYTNPSRAFSPNWSSVWASRTSSLTSSTP